MATSNRPTLLISVKGDQTVTNSPHLDDAQKLVEQIIAEHDLNPLAAGFVRMSAWRDPVTARRLAVIYSTRPPPPPTPAPPK